MPWFTFTTDEPRPTPGKPFRLVKGKDGLTCHSEGHTWTVTDHHIGFVTGERATAECSGVIHAVDMAGVTNGGAVTKVTF